MILSMKGTIIAYALAISSCLAQPARQGETRTYLVQYKKDVRGAENSLEYLQSRGALMISERFPSIGVNLVKMTDNEALKVASRNDIAAVELNIDNYQVLGWLDPVQPQDTQDGQRKLAEEIPYGIAMVRAGEGNDGNLYLPNTDIVSPKKVCVIDSGYINNHEDLPTLDATDGHSTIPGNVWSKDGCGHGTHCAGTIGALGGNEKGVIGVIGDETKLDLFIVRVFDDDCFWGSEEGLIGAVEECIEAGADIVSMSLGSTWLSEIEGGQFKQHYDDDNVLFIAAAGNDGNNSPFYPASHSHVMSVAAVDEDENRAHFSQFNSQVEISGPGVGVKSTYKGGGYASLSGTSMATPHVAGVAALVWGHFPDCTNNQIRHALVKSARPKAANGECDEEYGFGIVDAWQAYLMISELGCDGVVDNTGEILGGCAFVEGGLGPSNCKNWCKEITIPWNGLVGTTQKCDFTELCDGCPECVAPEAPDDYWIVCGKKNNCDPPFKNAKTDELHEVRCCSDISKPGWKKKASCDVWGESELPGCKHAETYESADQICKDNDARLCTRLELEGDCTAGSGCSHDHDHIWSSTPNA